MKTFKVDTETLNDIAISMGLSVDEIEYMAKDVASIIATSSKTEEFLDGDNASRMAILEYAIWASIEKSRLIASMAVGNPVFHDEVYDLVIEDTERYEK